MAKSCNGVFASVRLLVASAIIALYNLFVFVRTKSHVKMASATRNK